MSLISALRICNRDKNSHNAIRMLATAHNVKSRELGVTYCREIAECEDAEQTCLAAGTVSNDDELPTCCSG